MRKAERDLFRSGGKWSLLNKDKLCAVVSIGPSDLG